MSISYGNSVTKEFTDKEQIDTLIELLDSIKFSKINIKQEEKIFDKGKIFHLNTTFVIQLAKYQQGISEADIIVISEQELILADSETMRNSRTVSYMNQSDEASLKCSKENIFISKRSNGLKGLPSVATSKLGSARRRRTGITAPSTSELYLNNNQVECVRRDFQY